jgi:hypothetical protein
LGLVRLVVRQRKTVAAIGLGPELLARAGVLRGRSVAAMRERGEADQAHQRLLAIAAAEKNDAHVASRALFEAAMALTEAGEHRDAAALLARVGTEYPTSAYFGMTQFDLGWLLRNRLDERRAAIAAFRALIAGDCNDFDPTGRADEPLPQLSLPRPAADRGDASRARGAGGVAGGAPREPAR